MKKELKIYTVEQLCDGFVYDKAEGKGLFGLGGKLVIQPDYQRNYVYQETKREAPVIESALNNMPLGLIYLNKTGDDKYEVLDGQQRITSFGRYLTGQFAVMKDKRETDFNGLNDDEKQKIRNTELLVYIIEADNEQEIKRLFETINTQGLLLKEQEKRNASYCGSFVNLCKKVWSNSQNANIKKWSCYITGTANRQDYFETALDWVSNGKIDQYMSMHRHDTDIKEISYYFESVINWVSTCFKNNYDCMKGLNWGKLYREYHDKQISIDKLNARIDALMEDPSVSDKKGVYEFSLREANGETDYRLLNIRCFSKTTAQRVYNLQTEEAKRTHKSNCPLCALSDNKNVQQKIYDLKEMEADHVTAWSKGGSTDESNCQMLCKTHNRAKGNR